MTLEETIDQLKIRGFKVYKLATDKFTIFYRDPTVEETIFLDRYGKEDGISLLPIVRSVIISIEGIEPSELESSPTIVKTIVNKIKNETRLGNDEMAIEEYERINKEMDSNLVESMTFWISRQLAYPEFMHVSKSMSPSEFMKHVLLAENASGLTGFFKYLLTKDESVLSDSAKERMFPERYEVDNRPIWQQAGLNHEPKNISEARVVREYIKKMQESGQAVGPEVEEDVVPPSVAGRGLDPSVQLAIQSASRKLAQQVKMDNDAQRKGKERKAFFDWKSDEAAEQDFDK